MACQNLFIYNASGLLAAWDDSFIPFYGGRLCRLRQLVYPCLWWWALPPAAAKPTTKKTLANCQRQ